MKKLRVILFVILNLSFLISFGQPTEPILMLNTEMHTAMIRHISTDASGNYLLTCSDDKTARLWDAASGAWLQTFRIPLGYGKEGMLYACALSPDGKWAAVGGWTGYDWEKSNSIYIFNTSTGSLTQRLNGLGGVILYLKFSPDGAYLAAALGEGGVVVYKTTMTAYGFASEKYQTLTGYGSASCNVAFSSTGLFATVCLDGYIRLYDRSFNLLTQTTEAGKQPFSLAFSPDDSKIAVGYYDAKDVDVFSAAKLQLLYRPQLGDMDKNGGFANLTFSTNGETLYGGGMYQKNFEGTWRSVIRKWENAGRGSYTDYPACGNSVVDLKARPNQPDGVFFAGSQPDFGSMDRYGNKTLYKTGDVLALNANDKTHLKTNRSAGEVVFNPWGKQPLLFSLNQKSLSQPSANELASSAFKTYTDAKNGLTVTDWESTDSPKLNGNALSFLKQYETCRSVDISPTGNALVFGANWTIYCLDASGSQIWKTQVQGAAWAVNISADGKVVVAALGNGIIGWYRMSDGKPLLSLYVHPDGKRWVLWSPSGYFDCSPGADELIGWHLNNGPDKEAYFFPASKFRAKYYRPDVIENLLVTLNEDEAVRIANLASKRSQSVADIKSVLPPVVRILNPYNGMEVNQNTVTIKYTALSPNGEAISSLKILVDGRPIDGQRGFKPADTKGISEVQLTIPSNDVTVSVLAENANGWSEAANVSLKWKGSIGQDLLKPTLYVLAIGVSNYNDTQLKLGLAAKDARDFTATMQKQSGGLYKDVQVQLLTDAQATRTGIIKGLKWLKTQATSRDVAMLFISGHGVTDNTGVFYYLPVDADVNEIEATCLMFSDIKNTVAAVPGKIILFADACHSGNIMGGRRAVDVNGMVNELVSAENGAVVFTSSTGKQYSLEKTEWGNGAFTKALIEGMSGKADIFQKGTISVKTLDAYVAERVKQLTGGQQSPTTIIPQSVPDFPVGMVK